MEDQKNSIAGDLQRVTEKLLCKVEALVDQGDPNKLTGQGLKHISGVLKDIRDIQTARTAGEGAAVTVVLEGEMEEYAR